MNKPFCKIIIQKLVNVFPTKFEDEIFELDYEECVEIFSVFRTRKLRDAKTYNIVPMCETAPIGSVRLELWHGNEAYDEAMDKAENIFNSLPVTDY